jgi:hypothetical protein
MLSIQRTSNWFSPEAKDWCEWPALFLAIESMTSNWILTHPLPTSTSSKWDPTKVRPAVDADD